jgi:hypothetical protein
MMDQLAELADEDVQELQTLIVTEFETVEGEDPTPQSVDAMTSLADMLDAVRTEVKQRETLALELAQKAAEAASRVRGEDDEDMMEEEDMAMNPEADMPMDEEPMDEPSPEPVEVVEVEAEEEAPVADDEAPMEEVPVDEEDEDEDEEMREMSEASTTTDESAELSTEEEAEEISEAVTAAAEEGAEEVVETELSASDEVAATEEAVELSSEEEETVVEASVETTSEAEASTETPQITVNEPEAQNTLEAPVTAAAEENLDIEVPADRRPAARTPAATVAITAGADIPGYTAGSPLEDMNAVAEAMAKRIHTLRRVNGGDGEQHIVASVSTQFPVERTLSTDPEENWAKIQNVVGPEALVAAGGHQAPFEARYDIFGFGTTNRPVRDALPRFQADRGGIRYITPPVLSAFGDAVGVWTAANDAASLAGSADPATKAELVVDAATEVSAETDAVTLQLQFGNLVTRAYPELVARHNELGLIQHARVAEQYLIGKIAAGSTAVTTTSAVSFVRDFLVQVGRAAVAYRSRHRLEADASLRVILPAWLKDAMAADLALQMPGDDKLNAYNEVDGYLAARNVVASYSLDQSVYGSQSSGSLLGFAADFTWYMFAEGTFLFLDGGTLDLGIIRDSSLVGTNDYKMFVETFEGVAKVGIESLAITSAVNVTGGAAALIDTSGSISA